MNSMLKTSRKSISRGWTLGLATLVLVVLSLAAPRPAAAGLYVKAKAGPVTLKVAPRHAGHHGHQGHGYRKGAACGPRYRHGGHGRTIVVKRDRCGCQHKHKVWIEGHYRWDRCGRRVWVPGHWRRI